jgi:hypothetical protein
MQATQLPYWIAIMQALGPTIVTAAIGVFAWYIAWQQWRTAEKKRTQDLFEKRFRVFEATRRFLSEIELHGKPSKDALRLYANCITGAMFLFDDGLSKYLKEIQARAVSWQDNEARADRRPDGDEQRARLVDTATDENEWFLREASVSVLEEKFKKALTLG